MNTTQQKNYWNGWKVFCIASITKLVNAKKFTSVGQRVTLTVGGEKNRGFGIASR